MVARWHALARPSPGLPCGPMAISSEAAEASEASEASEPCASCGRPVPTLAEGACSYEATPVAGFVERPGPEWLVPEEIMQKESARCFDVVLAGCRHSTCFTKAYGRYIDGTGSVYLSDKLVESTAPSYAMQEFYGARYFTPNEVARLLGFKLSLEPCGGCLPRCRAHVPAAAVACRCLPFQLPPVEPSQARELWALLGNSLNPQVVALVCVACDLPELQKRLAPAPLRKVRTSLYGAPSSLESWR